MVYLFPSFLSFISFQIKYIQVRLPAQADDIIPLAEGERKASTNHADNWSRVAHPKSSRMPITATKPTNAKMSLPFVVKEE